MIKRETKRKIRNTAFFIFVAVAAAAAVIIFFFLWKFAVSAINIGAFFQTDQIIKPIADSSSLSDLEQKLSEKNIIMDALATASESGVFVGVIRSGPTVYFSQNLSASWQVDSLALIIRSATVGNKKPIVVDLRTTRPIVKF